MGAIVHAVLNRALSDLTKKNIFGNVNYAKHFFQGTREDEEEEEEGHVA